MTRYRLSEVRFLLREHWGLALYRGGELGDGEHDGRWDAAYTRGLAALRSRAPRPVDAVLARPRQVDRR